MDLPPSRRPGPRPTARSQRREARVAVALFWAVALLLVGARVALHDDIAGGAAPPPSGIVSTDASRPG